ncbi:hypothetical protein AFLA_003271 [Aspergillus flavus NRRL3357]|nr:hypothetical protein AFLA_003271 [Aspergillus flavus NRRL3357]
MDVAPQIAKEMLTPPLSPSPQLQRNQPFRVWERSRRPRNETRGLIFRLGCLIEYFWEDELAINDLISLPQLYQAPLRFLYGYQQATLIVADLSSGSWGIEFGTVRHFIGDIHNGPWRPHHAHHQMEWSNELSACWNVPTQITVQTLIQIFISVLSAAPTFGNAAMTTALRARASLSAPSDV